MENTSSTATTSQMSLVTIFMFGLTGPFWATVFMFYSIGYWIKGRTFGTVWFYLIGYPYGVFFAVLNTAHNWTVGTIIFRELPREFFTTTRCKRWKLSDDASRRELADLVGGFLDSRDAGHY